MSHLEYQPKTVREWTRFLQYYDSRWQTINNGAVRMSHVTPTSITQTEYYFGLDVPAGRRLVVYNRELKASEGLYRLDVVVPSGGFTGGTLATKSRLNPDSGPTVLSELYGDVTPSGDLTIADQDFIDTGVNIGSGRAGGAPSIDDVLVVIRGQSCLRVTSENGGASYRLGIRLIAWEEDYPHA